MEELEPEFCSADQSCNCQYKSTTYQTHPYFEMERRSSTLRFKCSHFVTTMPAPGAAAPLPMLLFMPLMPFVWMIGPWEFH